jgi:hypothetical protein
MLVSVVSAALADAERVSLAKQSLGPEDHTGPRRLYPTDRPPCRLSLVSLSAASRAVMALRVTLAALP